MSNGTPNEELEILREKIAKVDSEIIELLIKRFNLTDEVGIVKKKNNMPIENIVVEGRIIDRLSLMASQSLDPYFVSKVYREIFEESKKRQRRL